MASKCCQIKRVHICNRTEWYLKPSVCSTCKWIVRLCRTNPNYHELCISHHPQPVRVCHHAIAIPMQQELWMLVSVEQEVITQMQCCIWSGEVDGGRTWGKWEMQLCAMANVLVDMNNIIFPIYCRIYDEGHAMIGWWLNCTGFCYGFFMGICRVSLCNKQSLPVLLCNTTLKVRGSVTSQVWFLLSHWLPINCVIFRDLLQRWLYHLHTPSSVQFSVYRSIGRHSFCCNFLQ